jgi:hypothetical protein
MKYLNNFEEHNESKFTKFENSFINQYKRIEPELNDILLPFNDSNIKYYIHQYADDYIGEVTIFIEDKVEEFVGNVLNVSKKFFTWKEIKEEMLHVISFMDSEDIPFGKLEVQQIVEYKSMDNEFHNIEMYDESDIEELEDSFKFTEFNITFCKLP